MKKLAGWLMAIVILTGVGMSLSGCHKLDRCLRGNGVVVLEERGLRSFNRVVLNGSYEVNILPGSSHRVVVDAESNLIDFISTRVSGQTLVIESHQNRCLKNTVPVIINVYAPLVDDIELNGSGLITAYGLYLDEFFISLNGSGSIDVDLDVLFLQANISGSGRIDLAGLAETTDLSISGSGSIYAYPMLQSKCYATISGSGSMYVHVNRLLDAVISGSGTIYYRGNPDIVSAITGSGKLVKQ
jgi:hypothetical protein